MRVVLSTIGKFWTFDLARQMHKRGALTSIYSGYPRFKLKREGLPKKSIRTFPYLHAPYMRLSPRNNTARKLWEWQDRLWFDRYVAGRIPDCDILCGLSGCTLRAGRVVKSRGGKYVCDRGSSHIRVQDRILREEYDRQGIKFSGIDQRAIACEEAEYELADVITVPSTFSLNTFVESGVSLRKMKVVPYGVDLNTFYPSAKRIDDEFQILFVGNVTVRKGIGYLVDAFRKLNCGRKHLVLAGSISSELESFINELGRDGNVSVMGSVQQQRLKDVMSTSHVMVLPSVEDGFGLVMAQAMACGCPVIASRNTGGQDLFTDGVEGFIVPIRDSSAIADRLQMLADAPALRARMSEAAVQRVKSIGGWDQYGETMYHIFSELIES
jgi:glycosyltransferase involved in cell wall biosynthesis